MTAVSPVRLLPAALLVAALLLVFRGLPVLLAVVAALLAVLAVEVVRLQLLLSRRSFSAAMARNTP